MNKYKIGNFITTLRKEKGMTQEQLAEKLDISSKAVSKWETGKCFPETTQLIKMSKIFDVTIDEILYGERVDNPNDIHKEITEESYTKLRESEKSLKQSLMFLSIMFVLNGLSIFIFKFSILATAIYTCSLFAVMTMFLIYKTNNHNKEDVDSEKIKKGKKIAKVGLIVTIALTAVLLAYDVTMMIMLPSEEMLQFEIVSGANIPWWIGLTIFYIYHISIVPAVMYVIMCLKNPVFSGWFAGSIISMGFAAILIVILPAPVFMIAYYTNTIKVLNKNIN